MTEPSVRVGSAATAFNLPYNAKPPAGTPIVNSEGYLVEVFKKCFRENGVPWIVGVLAMVNILAISIHLERMMVPEMPNTGFLQEAIGEALAVDPVGTTY